VPEGIEIPKEIEDLLNNTCSTEEVDLIAPLRKSLSQRAVRLLADGGFGFDVAWDKVSERMSTKAQDVFTSETLVEKLKAFAAFDFQWLAAQLIFTTMSMPCAEKVSNHLGCYRLFADWYETLMELLMGHIYSLVGDYSQVDEDIPLLLTDFLEAHVAVLEGRKVTDAELVARVKEFMMGDE